MKSQILFILLAIVAGAVLPLQAGLNVQLGKSVHQPIFAAFASFLIGTIGLLIYLFILKFDFSSITQAKTVSPVVWTAGILGAFYVAAVIILAPKLGTALTFVLVVAGQMDSFTCSRPLWIIRVTCETNKLATITRSSLFSSRCIINKTILNYESVEQHTIDNLSCIGQTYIGSRE